MPKAGPDERKTSDNTDEVQAAIQKAKVKNARLRLMKERNENYLAEQREDEGTDVELTKELSVLSR